MDFFGSRSEFTRDDWQTPLYIVNSLGKFDLDPCASSCNPTRLATKGYTIEDDGLEKEWHGRVFLNPPYGSEVKFWIEKLSNHKDGIALIPPRVGSKWFHDIVFKTFDAILFLRGRIAFEDEEGYAVAGNNADSILIGYGSRNVEALKRCNLDGKLWENSHGN